MLLSMMNKKKITMNDHTAEIVALDIRVRKLEKKAKL
jgi:hypothetical protein